MNEYKTLMEPVRPSDDLNARTLDRIRGLRAGENEQAYRPKPLSRLTRAGAAVAIVAGLALATPALIPSGISTPGSEQAAGASHAFGLAIANAAEPGNSVAVQSTGSGIMPARDTIGWHQALELNLSLAGRGVSSVEFRVLGSGTNPTNIGASGEPGTAQWNTVSIGSWIWASNGTDAPAFYPAGSDPNDLGSLTSTPEEVANSEVTISYDSQGADGIYHTTDGVYNLLSVAADEAEFYRSDETLRSLYRLTKASIGDVLDEDLNLVGTRAGNPKENPESWANVDEELPELRDAYETAFDEVTSTRESTLAWAKKNYVSGIALAAKQVAATTLEATATYEDGSTETRLYRIQLADNYEQVLSSRFDALCAIKDPTDEIVKDRLPWATWDKEAVEKASETDARLTAPIYTIADITE